MKILVPIDFSEDAETALEYALVLAKRKEGSVTMVHVVEIVYDFASQGAIALDGMYNDAHSLMEKLQHKYAGSGIPIDFIIKEGTASITASRTAEEIGAKLIVMGTRGSSGARKFLFGSTTISLIKETKVPVLVIPENANMAEMNSLTLALEFSDHEEKFIEWVVDLSQNWEMKLDFFHVSTEINFKEKLATLGIEGYLNKNFPKLDSRISLKLAQTASQGLNEFLNEQNNSILVLCHEHKSFWEQLTKSSDSVSLAYTARTPLLILV